MEEKRLTTTASSIGRQNSRHVSSLSRSALTPSATVSAEKFRPTERRIIQNFRLVWLTPYIDKSSVDFCDCITSLRRVVNDTNIFTDVDECVNFLSEITDEKVFMILADALGECILVPLIYDMSQLDSIFVLCEDESRHERWKKNWPKIKGVFTEIGSICHSLEKAARRCDQNTISVSFLPISGATSESLDQLDQSFMYTQILKEILLEISHDEQFIKEFTAYCRRQYDDNDAELDNINTFEREYHLRSPIWWYTYTSFLYPTLNRALRTQEIETIIKMGFFIHDLHQQIEKLHSDQFGGQSRQALTAYRGQGLSKEDFEKLLKTKGGLMSFNNFLSTSKDRAVSFAFADSNRDNLDLIGILFQINIDTSISTTPFALINEFSYYETEQELLFSTHTVFRIGEIEQLDQSNRLWQVELKLTSDNDLLLGALTERIRKETKGLSGWDRLGQLLVSLGHFEKAEEVYSALLDQKISNDAEKAHYYHQLGVIKYSKGDYVMAMSHYEKSLEIQETLPQNHFDLTASYSNIGSVHVTMGECSQALSFYEKALQIRQNTLPSNHPDIATSYNNIALVYVNMGEYGKALSFYEKSLEMRQKTLPSNHPDLAASYCNIGWVYGTMSEYSKALSYHEKALEIEQKTLPSNHPSLATSFSNIGSLYLNMGEYLKALSFYERNIEIRQKMLPSDHPDLATSYNNIGLVYDNMGEYSKALSFYEKAIEIIRKVLPPDHPDLATSYNNMGNLNVNMREYLKALSFYEKALEISQKALPSNHPDLATAYNNIASVYDDMGEYSKALSFYERDLEISQEVLPPHHPDLATSYCNIGSVYDSLGEYSKALSFHEKALEISLKVLPPNHPDLATSYNNIASVYQNMGEYSKALSFYEKDLKILQRSLPENHPDLREARKNIDCIRKKCK
jgi:tetratricopeptide (TPR) repeat protein